ncbi:hypothetical protein H1R20_g7348, partial [Candolleomyces eurysporus]
MDTPFETGPLWMGLGCPISRPPTAREDPLTSSSTCSFASGSTLRIRSSGTPELSFSTRRRSGSQLDCERLRNQARLTIATGLVASPHPATTPRPLRLIVHPTNPHHLKPWLNFIVYNAHGPTVDLKMTHLEIAEMHARLERAMVVFADLRFRELVKALDQTSLAYHPAHLDPASLACFIEGEAQYLILTSQCASLVHSFSETDRRNYSSLKDDEDMFHFTCFNAEDPHDLTVGPINRQLSWSVYSSHPAVADSATNYSKSDSLELTDLYTHPCSLEVSSAASIQGSVLSDSGTIIQYTDQDEILESCEWTNLPQNAATSNMAEIYTQFVCPGVG